MALSLNLLKIFTLEPAEDAKKKSEQLLAGGDGLTSFSKVSIHVVIWNNPSM